MAVDFESILVKVGSFGRYQLCYAILLGIPAVFTGAFVGFAHIFLSATPDHWCAVPELINMGIPLHVRKNISIPTIVRDDVRHYSRCEMYRVNYTEIFNQTEGSWPKSDPTWPKQKCEYGWEYDTTNYDFTLVTQFDLVCDKNWWPSFATSIFYGGGLIGSLIFGWISDNYGRRRAFFLNLLIVVTLPIVSAFSPSYEIYSLIRFLTGLGFPAVFQISLTMVMEVTDPNHRTAFGMMYNLVWGFAFGLLGLIAYLCRNWFVLTLATSVPFMCLLVYWWIILESPRWLISRNKVKEAEVILRKIAKINKKNMPSDAICENETHDDNSEIQYVHPLKLCSSPNMRRKTIVLSIIWWIMTVVYVSLSYLSVSMSINDYLAFALSGLVEVPACLVAWYGMQRWGRRRTIFITMIIVGICCVTNAFISADMTVLDVGLPVIGKFGITAAFGVSYVFNSELLPTIVRSSGMAFCYLLGITGLIAFPYITYFIVYSRFLPYLTIGIISFIGGLITCLLPETLDRALPETLEEGENFGKDVVLFKPLAHCNRNPR